VGEEEGTGNETPSILDRYRLQQVERAARRVRCPTLTDHDGHQEPGEPLLLHLLDARLVSGGDSLAHDGEGVDVGHRANSGGGHPRQAEQSRAAAQHHDQQQVQMEAGALGQHPLLLTDDQAAGSQEEL